ncbi:hypothetical protein [Streptomyces anthocyanicus]|uniref:hypothetical protein n=1 Tax=Streptomyces anthocyanicus TaxID=68174 RepID=UPI0037F8C651
MPSLWAPDVVQADNKEAAVGVDYGAGAAGLPYASAQPEVDAVALQKGIVRPDVCQVLMLAVSLGEQHSASGAAASGSLEFLGAEEQTGVEQDAGGVTGGSDACHARADGVPPGEDGDMELLITSGVGAADKVGVPGSGGELAAACNRGAVRCVLG